MKTAAIAILLLFAGCGEPPRKSAAPAPDPTLDPAYAESVAELAKCVSQARAFLASGNNDAAAAAITSGQPIAARVLAAPHPTLAAMESASDLDDLYGRMLLSNKNYGWARMTFQKNRSRWQHWQPQTEDTVKRKKQAEAGIAACDQGLR
jgi:hypothetical protein